MVYEMILLDKNKQYEFILNLMRKLLVHSNNKGVDLFNDILTTIVDLLNVELALILRFDVTASTIHLVSKSKSLKEDKYLQIIELNHPEVIPILAQIEKTTFFERQKDQENNVSLFKLFNMD